jgi:hypothetical protein
MDADEIVVGREQRNRERVVSTFFENARRAKIRLVPGWSLEGG